MKSKLTAAQREALLHASALGSHWCVLERFRLSTWRALSRRLLIDLYLDADRKRVTNIRLTDAGRTALKRTGA